MRGPPEVSVLRGFDRAQHRGWYTFAVNTAAGGVYTFGADAKEEAGAKGFKGCDLVCVVFLEFWYPVFLVVWWFSRNTKTKASLFAVGTPSF